LVLAKDKLTHQMILMAYCGCTCQ